MRPSQPPLKIEFSPLNFIFFSLSLNFESLKLLQKGSFRKSKPISMTVSVRTTKLSDQNFENRPVAKLVGKSNFSHSIIAASRCPPLYSIELRL